MDLHAFGADRQTVEVFSFDSLVSIDQEVSFTIFSTIMMAQISIERLPLHFH